MCFYIFRSAHLLWPSSFTTKVLRCRKRHWLKGFSGRRTWNSPEFPTDAPRWHWRIWRLWKSASGHSCSTLNCLSGLKVGLRAASWLWPLRAYSDTATLRKSSDKCRIQSFRHGLPVFCGRRCWPLGPTDSGRTTRPHLYSIQKGLLLEKRHFKRFCERCRAMR